MVEEKGMLSDPNPKQGKQTEKEVIGKVKRFYGSEEEVSRTNPGKKML